MIDDSVQGRACAGSDDDGPAQHVLQEQIHSVADIKGKKIRVQATMTEDANFPAYGAQTVHMPFGEVYTSLQTGVVAIAENGVNVYMANKHYEVAPVLSITEHEANNNCIWVRTRPGTASRLSSRAGYRQPPTKSPRRSRRWLSKLEADSAVKLKSMGVKPSRKGRQIRLHGRRQADPGRSRQEARPACGEAARTRARREVIRLFF